MMNERMTRADRSGVRAAGVGASVAFALGLALAAAGCGAASVNTGNPDAGEPSTDAGSPCGMAVQFSPPAPQAGTTVVAAGTILDSTGVETYSWQVLSPAHKPVTVHARDQIGSQVDFLAQSAGPYEVRLDGTSDGLSCTEDVETLNVAVPGANSASYRLRADPPASSQAVAQEFAVTIPGGADYDLGTLTLQSGTRVAGVVSGPKGAPLPAYLRLHTSRSNLPIEAFADADGAFVLALPPLGAPYDLLVVPSAGAVAPVQFSGLAGADLAAIAVPAGIAVAGHVVDSSGTAVVGARVSLTVAGVPSTLATTDSSGAFSVRARAGSAEVSVVPPAGAGLPLLELPASAAISVSDGSSLQITYAATATRTFAAQVVETDGATAAAGARVTFSAGPIANAAAIKLAGGTAVEASGRVRDTVVADGTGKLPSLTLPQAAYQVVAEPGSGAGAGEGIALRSIDLTAAAPAQIALAAPAKLTGSVVDTSGQPVAGAEVSAHPAGVLADTATAGADATTAADGSFALDVAGGGDYEIVATPPTGTRATPARIAKTTAPAAGGQAALGQMAFGAAIRVSGRLAVPGGTAASGFSVELLCDQCTGVDAARAIAQAATGGDGGFALMVSDPGTAALRH